MSQRSPIWDGWWVKRYVVRVSDTDARSQGCCCYWMTPHHLCQRHRWGSRWLGGWPTGMIFKVFNSITGVAPTGDTRKLCRCECHGFKIYCILLYGIVSRGIYPENIQTVRDIINSWALTGRKKTCIGYSCRVTDDMCEEELLWYNLITWSYWSYWEHVLNFFWFWEKIRK